MSVKRVCLPFEKDPKPYDVFITRKTNFAAQIKKCRKLLDTKFDTIRIQATGVAIPRAFRLATVLNDNMKNTINIDVKTTTLLARDVINEDALLQERCVSAVVIRISRLYTCAGLISRLPRSKIDIFDRSAIPYGLIQYGVAPDHYDVKRCTNQFEKLIVDNSDRISLFCNVQIGQDLTFDELCRDYDAVILAYGANKARRLNIPGSDARNCISGSDFVTWYNGGFSPYTPLLDNKKALIIGNGNVSIDCSRILLSPVARLAPTDIPENALKVLRSSQVDDIQIVGRRGPVDASFTIKELRELLNLENCTVSTSISDNETQRISDSLEKFDRPKKRIMQLMLERRIPKNPNGLKKCQIEFFQKPVSIDKDPSGRIQAVDLQNTLTGEIMKVPCGLLIYAIGFENVLLPGLPKTKDDKLLLKDWCRVDSDVSKVYATGWCAHNPAGVIAQTQSQAVAVADEVAKDLRDYSGDRGRSGSRSKLEERKVAFLTFSDWKYVDECERMMGRILGKLREKIQNVSEFVKLGR